MSDYNDMERFYDTCEDTRTQKQIVWEEGIYKEGSFRSKWAYSFGKNGFYKFGKKTASFLMLMFFWTGLLITVNNVLIRDIFQVAAVVIVNLSSIWLFRQCEANKKFTKLNIIYIVCCGVFAVVFFRYMDFVFGRLGHSVFLSLYYGVYIMSKYSLFIIRLIISALLIFNILKYNRSDILSAGLAVIAVATGILYRFVFAQNNILYFASIILLMLIAVLGFLLYTKNKNRFLRNIILIFSFVSMMEIIGSHAVFTGAMESYIEDGVW